MKKKYDRLSKYGWVTVALTIGLFFILAVVSAEEPPALQTGIDDSPPSTQQEPMSKMFKGRVVEMINAGRYAYIKIDTGEKRVWVAVPAFDGKPGDTVLVPPGIPVADFQSKKLNRKFEMIYFVGSIRREGEGPATQPPQK